MEINKTLIIPCKDEGMEFEIILKRFIDYLKQDTEIVVVVDDESDSTVQATEKFENINLLINSLTCYHLEKFSIILLLFLLGFYLSASINYVLV